MKKKVFLIPLAMFMVTGTVGLAACDTVEHEQPAQPSDDTKTLKGIAVDTPPTKTEYTDGDNFDPTGLKIKASYTDGTSEIVDGWTVDKTKLTVSDTVVTITYTKGTVTLTTTVSIKVNPKVDPGTKTLTGIAVTTQPTKTHYEVGEVFDKAGMVVTASYSNSDPADVTEHVTTDKDGVPLTADDKVITVSYTEGGLTCTDTVNITVGDEPTPPGPDAPEHAGTLEDPYTTSDAKIVCDGLKGQTSGMVYVEGIVAATPAPKQEGQNDGKGVTFYTTDGKTSVQNYFVKGIGGVALDVSEIEAGDHVVVQGVIKDYNGTVEICWVRDQISCELVEHSKPTPADIISVDSVVQEGLPTQVEVGESIDKNSIWLNVTYSNGNHGLVNPDTITFDNTTEATGVVVSCVYGTFDPVTFTINVVAKAEKVVGDFYKVKSQSDIVEGQYLLVWEGDTETRVFTGIDAANDFVTAENQNGHIAAGTYIKVELEAMDGGFAMKVVGGENDGKYMYGTSGKNGLLFGTNKALHTIEHKAERDLIICDSTYLSYNTNASDQRFRYYKADTQKPVHLYKMHEGEPTPATLESIDASMSNTTYRVGEQLSLEGLTVTGHYSDGSEKVITEGIETSMEAGKVLTIDDTSLEVSVGDIKTTITLTVMAADVTLVSISLSGVKESYYAGDLLGEVVVTAHYSDENSSTVSAELKIGDTVVDATHVMALGESKLVATYQGENAEAEFTVVEDTVKSLAVSEEHRSFYTGDEFVKETVTATYESGKTKDVTGEASFTGYKMDVADTYTVTVSYGGQETTYDITVTYKEVYTPVALTKDASIGGTDATFNEIAGIKCGTSSSGGSVDLTLPKGTTKVSFYAAAWKGETTSLTVSGLGENKEFSLTADDGMTGNSPFTLVKDIETFHITFDLTSPLTAQKKITVASEGKRFGIWDAGVKVEEIHVTGVEIVGYPDEIYVGDKLTVEDFLIDVTYDKAPKQEGIHPDSYVLDTSAAGKASLTVTFDGFTTEPLEVEIKEARYVTGVTIVDYPKEITEGDEISVSDILVDVTYSVGGDSEGIHPDSYSLSVPVGGKASLTATVGGVSSTAVEVTVKKADVLTPIELSTTGGTNASECKVQISSDNARDGIKCGTSSKAGTMQMVLPAGTAKVVFYAAGWTGTSATLSVTGLDSEKTVSLKANAGLTGNSPFTFSGVEDFSEYKIEIVLDAPLASETTITLAAGNTRFAVWDAAVVIEQKTVTGVEITDWPKSIEQDYVIKEDEVTVTLTYDDGTTATGKHPQSVHCNASEVGTTTLTATVGDITSAEVNVEVTEPVTVTAVEITDWPESVDQKAVIEAKDVKVDVSYSDGSSKTGINPDSVYCDTSAVGTAKLTATVGGVTSEEVDVTVNAVDPSTEKTATIAYSGSTTGNMDGTNQASALGCTETAISVVGTKENGGQNNVGLNSAGQMRLYSKETCALTISISGGTITKLDVVFGGTFGGLNCNGKAVSDAAANSTVSINVDGTSAVLTNPNTGKTQTYILSVVIYYTLN